MKVYAVLYYNWEETGLDGARIWKVFSTREAAIAYVNYEREEWDGTEDDGDGFTTGDLGLVIRELTVE